MGKHTQAWYNIPVPSLRANHRTSCIIGLALVSAHIIRRSSVTTVSSDTSHVDGGSGFISLSHDCNTVCLCVTTKILYMTKHRCISSYKRLHSTNFYQNSYDLDVNFSSSNGLQTCITITCNMYSQNHLINGCDSLD